MDQQLENLISKAEHLAEIERWREAIPLLLKVLAQNPQHFQANCLHSLCHCSIGDFEKAIEFAEKAIAVAPEEEWGHRLRSIALGEIGKKKEALKSAEEAARLAPYEPFALQVLTNAYLSANKTKKAEEIALKMRENFPETETSFFVLGNVYLQKRDNYEAAKCFREALRLNPNCSDARNNLGVALLRQNDADDYMFIKPTNLSILDSENDAKIHEHFKEAIKIDPNHKTAAENLENQFGYYNTLYFFLIFLPFLVNALVVAPGITVFFTMIWVFGIFKTLGEIRRRRKTLSPELKMFLKSSANKNLSRRFKEFKTLAKAMYQQTWKPHVLAFVALIVWSIEFGDTIGTSSRTLNEVLAFVLIFVSTMWLGMEIRKD
jgi:predicted Zn-dependent protease